MSPKFFSFPEDLSRLERVLGINIVVARAPQAKGQDFLRIHDRRVYSHDGARPREARQVLLLVEGGEGRRHGLGLARVDIKGRRRGQRGSSATRT